MKALDTKVQVFIFCASLVYAQQRQHQQPLELSDYIISQKFLLLEERLKYDEQRITDITIKIHELENQVAVLQHGSDRQIAVLQTEVNELIRVESWVAAGVGSLILGVISVLLKRATTTLISRAKTRLASKHEGDDTENDNS